MLSKGVLLARLFNLIYG
ncbi:hypothetical protein [Escherichia coli]|nr:hypothetical protein [Escherichia coli]